MAKNYTAQERKAYHMGRAYGAAKLGKRVKCPSEKAKKFFRNGIASVGGRSKANNKREQQCSNCGESLFVVNGDGVIVGKLGGKK